MKFKNKDDILQFAYTLSKTGKIVEAIKVFKKVNAFYPTNYTCLYQISRLYLEMKDYPEACKYYKKLIKIYPGNLQANFDLSFIYLLKRDLKKGFRYYEKRFGFEDFNHILTNKYPKNIKNLNDKKVFIYWEQGYGDTINFIRYVNEVLCYTKEIDIFIQKPLIRFMQYNFKSINFVDEIDYKNKKYDYIIPLLSLPYILKLDAFVPLTKYLKIRKKDKSKKNKDKVLKIGLCWQGEYKNKRDYYRSFEIDEFLKLLSNIDDKYSKNIKLYSLQKDLTIKNKGVINLGTNFSDFYDTAVAVDKLDLVITVDTAICHLSASLGKKTYLLNAYLSDWRWGLELYKSDLYTSIQYFRQEKKGSWAKPLNQVVEKIVEKLNEKIG